MAGKSPVVASEEQKAELRRLSVSRDRGEADRARALLLTLSGWTSPRIAEAFGVREDTVRQWRSDFARGGVEALKTNPASGPAPVSSEATATLRSETSFESSAVRLGASPTQNGMVGRAPSASVTRTSPAVTRRMRHE